MSAKQIWLSFCQTVQEAKGYEACNAAGEVAVHSHGKPPKELHGSHAT